MMLGQAIVERNALGGRAPASETDRLSVTSAADYARFSVRLALEAHDQAAQCFGCPLPVKIGGMSVEAERIALCLGPDEWFLMAPSSEGGAIAKRFGTDMGAPHSLVDVSHREVGIEVRGPAANLALRAICALDLDSMPASSCTRTILDKAQVVLLKLARDHYRIEVWPSFADHVWGLLAEVSREIALNI
jgi:sarcosine oxidase subunit gamma